MKQICKMIVISMTIGIVLVQLMLAVGEYAGFKTLMSFPVPEMVYLGTVSVGLVIQLIILRPPHFPVYRTMRLLGSEGYSPAFYSEVFAWHKKCVRRGEPYKTHAELTLSEVMIDGGHFTEGMKRLDSLDISALGRKQRLVYYNTYLYGALQRGDTDTARRIYADAADLLKAVSDKALSASVRHTLGCYEYSEGRIGTAEKLFVQALENASADDVRCEIWLSLTACYLDTGRLTNARSALCNAADCAVTLPMKQKVARAKELCDNAKKEPRNAV